MTRARLIGAAALLVAIGAIGLAWMVVKAQEVPW